MTPNIYVFFFFFSLMSLNLLWTYAVPCVRYSCPLSSQPHSSFTFLKHLALGSFSVIPGTPCPSISQYLPVTNTQCQSFPLDYKMNEAIFMLSMAFFLYISL